MARRTAHVMAGLPHAAVHTMVGLHCWCMPEYEVVCDDCTSGCWRCEGGWRTVGIAGAEGFHGTVVVTHKQR